MKINAKVLKPMLLTAAAIMLVVATVFATMAYMTSSAAVSNVFTVGNVKLQMFETKVDKNGDPVDPNPDPNAMKTADTNSYHLMPGVSYLKDPTIYVGADSDESYLFIRVRNDLKTIEKQGDSEHLTIVEQLRKNGWLEIERASTNVDAVFVYVGSIDLREDINNVDVSDCNTESERTAKVLAALSSVKAKIVGGTGTRQDISVFEEFTLADKIENLDMYGGARVAIVAYAIQVRGISEEEDIGTQTAYLAAWEYIKNELPFVV